MSDKYGLNFWIPNLHVYYKWSWEGGTIRLRLHVEISLRLSFFLLVSSLLYGQKYHLYQQ